MRAADRIDQLVILQRGRGVDDDALGSETNGIFGAGGGIRFFFNPVVHFRLEYRFNRFEGDGQVFVNGEDFDFNEFSFGIGWRFPSH